MSNTPIDPATAASAMVENAPLPAEATRPIPSYLPTPPILEYLRMLQQAHMQAAVSLGHQIEQIYLAGEKIKADQESAAAGGDPASFGTD